MGQVGSPAFPPFLLSKESTANTSQSSSTEDWLALRSVRPPAQQQTCNFPSSWKTAKYKTSWAYALQEENLVGGFDRRVGGQRGWREEILPMPETQASFSEPFFLSPPFRRRRAQLWTIFAVFWILSVANPLPPTPFPANPLPPTPFPNLWCRERKISPKFSCIELFHMPQVSTEIPGRPDAYCGTSCPF